MSEARITRVSRKQLERMEDKTDWARVDALTDEDIERAVAEDPDAAPFWTEEDWKNARVVWPQGKAPVTLRLDRDIIAWFKAWAAAIRPASMPSCAPLSRLRSRTADPASVGASPRRALPIKSRAGERQRSERP